MRSWQIGSNILSCVHGSNVLFYTPCNPACPKTIILVIVTCTIDINRNYFFGKTGVLRCKWHFSVYLFLYWTSLCRKKNWWRCGIAHMTFLNRLAQIKVCSHAIVLKPFGTLSSGLYSFWHFVSTWFRRCNLSITFPIHFHAWSKGLGRGRFLFDTKRPSKWHMLSYARITDDIAWIMLSSLWPTSFKRLNLPCSQRTVMRNACVGDSDLKSYSLFTIYVVQGE